MVRKQVDARLLGVGLDSDDGQVRVTRGDNFHLVGGSAGTHESMQEKCIKFNEKLSKRGKELGELERAEFIELAQSCEMNIVLPGQAKRPGPASGSSK